MTNRRKEEVPASGQEASLKHSNFKRHLRSCDILVAGGGLSGVACALAACRSGASVILVQDRPVLGGNASSEVRMHAVGANSGRPGKDLTHETRETGVIEEIRLENAFRNPQRSPSMFDLILYEKCRSEERLQLLLNTSVTAVQTSGSSIEEVEAQRVSTNDIFNIRAKVFVDCTGDGGLGAAAGANAMQGREDRAAYGETLALERADHKVLGSTLLFMTRKHDRPMPFIAPPWARKFTENDLRLRSHATPDVDYGLEYGFWWIEWGGHLDTIKDNELIRDELLAIVMGVWDHIKNDGDHGAECWALDWFGFVPGKRESRRFIGQHVLTEFDILESRPQPDAIAYGGWPIDLHPPEGVDRPDERPCMQKEVPFLYDIPLRCCVAKDFDNLMFAGRNISATHVAFASTRVMATCAAIGQGVGVAAAFGVENGVPPSRLAFLPEAVADIQQRLLCQDAFLIGIPYEGQRDLAFTARIRASSEQAGGEAANVVSAQTRAITDERGVPPGREIAGSHRWMSDPSRGLPAWIELSWEHPVELFAAEIIFDTGLHRHLTLTQSESYHRTMCWGVGQPECVKSYRIAASLGGVEQTEENVRGNWQRRAWHRWAKGVKCDTLRVTVEEMWNLSHARIMRIICHGAKEG